MKFLSIILIFLLPVLLYSSETTIWKVSPIVPDRNSLVNKFIGQHYSLNVATNSGVINYRYTGIDTTRLEWSDNGTVKLITLGNTNAVDFSSLSNSMMGILDKVGLKDSVLSSETKFVYFDSTNLLRLTVTKVWKGLEVVDGDRVELNAVRIGGNGWTMECVLMWFKLGEAVVTNVDVSKVGVGTNTNVGTPVIIYRDGFYWMDKVIITKK